MRCTTALALALVASATAKSTFFKRQNLIDGDDDDYAVDVFPCDPSDAVRQIQVEEYLENVCTPLNATQQADLDVPCWQTRAIELECTYGTSTAAEILGDLATHGHVDDPSLWNATTLSNSTQRVCMCQSQFFAAFQACYKCYIEHGDPLTPMDMAVTSICASFSTSYCAATNTPTAGFGDAWASFDEDDPAWTSTTPMTSTFSDPLHNSTDVSLYQTPSVTGSAAWVVADATSTGSGSALDASSTSAHISDGQIVATAVGSAASASSGSGSNSSSSSSAGGAQQTAAVAGVIALAGFVALL